MLLQTLISVRPASLLSCSVIFLLLWTACQQTVKPPQRSDYTGIFSGVLPCADCSGLAYQINLSDDGRYVSTEIYQGKSATPFRREGEYAVDTGNRILLNPGLSDQQILLFEKDGYWWLDREGKRINGNLAAHYRLSRKTETGRFGQAEKGSRGDLSGAESNAISQEGTELFNQKKKEGVRFYATGTEPFWSLEWKEHSGWKIQMADGESTIFDPVEPVYVADSGLYRFRFANPGQFLVLQVKEERCINDMSGAEMEFTIEVLWDRGVANERRYLTGCGMYLQKKTP